MRNHSKKKEKKIAIQLFFVSFLCFDILWTPCSLRACLISRKVYGVTKYLALPMRAEMFSNREWSIVQILSLKQGSNNNPLHSCWNILLVLVPEGSLKIRFVANTIEQPHLFGFKIQFVFCSTKDEGSF